MLYETYIKPKYGCADSIKRFPPSVYTILGYFCYDCRRTNQKVIRVQTIECIMLMKSRCTYHWECWLCNSLDAQRKHLSLDDGMVKCNFICT